jgi:NAD(P)-dependent dehydrogenase (short-subunit alcohol dehydrogenase family)
MAQRVVICTGAASGIGESAARAFARDGYAVVLADRSTDTGEKLADELRRQGAQATFVRLDIADEASVQACIDAAVQAYGHVDAAVNCAGIGGPSMPGATLALPSNWEPRSAQRMRSPQRHGSKSWTSTRPAPSSSPVPCVLPSFALRGQPTDRRRSVAYWLTQKPRRVREADEQWKLAEVTQRGSLVNIASINATLSSKNMAAYVAAKHAVAGISKNFAYEYVDQVRSTVESFVLKLNWDQGIRVNTVSPGFVRITSELAPSC